MSRVVLVGLKADEDRILSFLHDRGVVQVEPISKEAMAHLTAERPGEEHRRLAEEHLRFKALVAALPPTPVPGRRHFPDIPSLLRAAAAVKVDEDVRRAKREEDALLTERKELEDHLRLVRTYAFFPEDLSVLVAKSVLSYMGEGLPERYAAFREEVAALSTDVLFVEQPEPKRIRFVVSVPRSKAEAFGRLAQKHTVRLTAVPELDGTPVALVPRLEGQLADVEGRVKQVRAALHRLSERWYATILPIEEQLQVEARKADLHGRLAGVRSTFALEGYVPRVQVAPLRSELERLTRGRTEMYDVPAGPEAPTLLRNPQGTKIYEFFIRFFSLPQSSEIDPTVVFAVIFPLFFGIMLGDVGYGAFILAVCLWMIWRIGNPKAGPTIVPRFLVKFTTMVMPPPAMKQLAKCLVPGALLAIFLGVGFDAYFGFTLGQLTGGLVDFAPLPTSNGLPAPVVYIAKLLLVSVYVGLAMVTLGLIFGAINRSFHGERRHALAQVCWILVAWGITLLGLSMVHHNYPGSWLITPNPPASGLSTFQIADIAVLLLGIVGAVAAEGKLMAVMEVATMVSHTLSFARLVGILLASVILAYVVNLIAVVGGPGQPALITHGVVGIVGGLLLVVVIAVFNIILGVFEPGIQGARLLYVEYFSKFYSGNGRPFKPFGGTRSYTMPQHVPGPAPPTSPASAASLRGPSSGPAE